MSRSSRIRKIGVMGGTFNPPHFGHLIPVQQAAEEFQLEKVLFVPAFQSPHKHNEPVPDPYHRVAMLALALQKYPAFALSTIELNRGSVSYTVDTLRALQDAADPDARLFFIMGSDSFLEIQTWRSPAQLLQLCDLIIINRGAVEGELKRTLEQLETQFRLELNSSIHLASSPHLPISSTAIRNAIRCGNSISGMLPFEVEEYINRNQVYERR